MYEIWDDTNGECIEVGPDRDGLDMVEIRLRDARSGKIESRVSFSEHNVFLLIEALTKAANALKAKLEEEKKDEEKKDSPHSPRVQEFD